MYRKVSIPSRDLLGFLPRAMTPICTPAMSVSIPSRDLLGFLLKQDTQNALRRQRRFNPFQGFIRISTLSVPSPTSKHRSVSIPSRDLLGFLPGRTRTRGRAALCFNPFQGFIRISTVRSHWLCRVSGVFQSLPGIY